MTDEQIGYRLRHLVKNKGVCPIYHTLVIHWLRNKWPLLYALIVDIEAER